MKEDIRADMLRVTESILLPALINLRSNNKFTFCSLIINNTLELFAF